MAGGAVATLSVTTASAQEESHFCQQEVQDTNNDGWVGICKTGPDTAVAGTDIQYSIEIKAHTRKNFFEVTDTVPEGTTLVSAAGDPWDCSASADPTVDCTYSAEHNADEAIDGSVITVTVHINSDFTDEGIENCADVSSHWQKYQEADAETGDYSQSRESCWDTTVTRSSDISVVKTGPASLEVPNDITYTVTATNNGPSDSDPVTVTDTFPANTTFVTTGGGIADWDCGDSSGGTLTCTTLAGIVSGGSASFTVTLHVSGDQAGVTLENCASVTAGDTSGVTDNDTGCATIDGTAVTLVEAAQAALPVTGVAPHFTG